VILLTWFRNYRKKRLCRLLTAAADELTTIRGPIWSSYASGPALAEFIRACKDEIEQGTISKAQKRELWGIFAPTSDWDDVVGDVWLGNAIFELLEPP
jgi:hypothetical protein